MNFCCLGRCQIPKDPKLPQKDWMMVYEDQSILEFYEILHLLELTHWDRRPNVFNKDFRIQGFIFLDFESQQKNEQMIDMSVYHFESLELLLKKAFNGQSNDYIQEEYLVASQIGKDLVDGAPW